MVKGKQPRLSRDDWLKAALSLCTKGIDKVKIAPLAEQLGVTTGSFYWHFRNRGELLDALLEYWEREMTDVAVVSVKHHPGPPAKRIFNLMNTVMSQGLARYDLPIWQWSQTDAKALHVFKRALKKRFSVATWLFSEAGFSREQAEVRGRMMAIYMMGESTLIPVSMAKRQEYLKMEHSILTAPEQRQTWTIH